MAKDIEHVLDDGRWRMIQNCRVYQRAQFLNIDHRLVVATLKSQLKSGRMVPSQSWLDVGKLKDKRVAEEFANRLCGDSMWMDKEVYVRGICEGVEHHLWSSDSHPAYRGIHALRSSKPVSWCAAVKAEGGGS